MDGVNAASLRAAVEDETATPVTNGAAVLSVGAVGLMDDGAHALSNDAAVIRAPIAPTVLRCGMGLPVGRLSMIELPVSGCGKRHEKLERVFLRLPAASK